MKHLHSKPELTHENSRYIEKETLLFAEKKFVFFSETKGPGEGGKGKEDKEKKEKAPVNVGGEKETEVDKIAARTLEKVHQVLDSYEYELPADIDPGKIKESRDALNKYYPELKKLEESVDGFVNELIAEMEPIEGSMPAAPDELWKGVYSAVPEFTQAELRAKEGYNPSAMYNQLAPNILKQNIIATWKKYGKKQPSPAIINSYVEKLNETIKQIAKNEFEVLRIMDQVREVMWDVHEKLLKKSIEERLIKSATRRTGIPIKEGQELLGYKRKITKGLEPDKPFEDRIPCKWIIKEVYVNKKMVPDPEAKDKNQKAMLMQGVWVALEEKGSGRMQRMSTNRLRDFMNIHEITPAVKNKKDIRQNVDHLSEMGINPKAGDTLEYDEMKIDAKTNKPVAETKRVKILSIDDNGVRLDKKVLYKAFYDSPDEKDHTYKDDFTLGEFAKWMNQKRPVPVMKLEPLIQKLEDHHDYMNEKYKRAKNCHAKIMLYPGEILHADAPGNPLFEVESVDELQQIIKLKGQRSFTFPQFLRWVYENDIEPYYPDLEALKMKTYFKAGNKSVKRAEEDAQSTIKHFKDTGIWRDTLKKLREKGVKGIYEPTVPLKEEELGNVERQSYSRIAQWLKETQWLRLDDIFKLFSSGWEYYVRNWQRRQKARYSSVGKNIPFFGTEFERINQQAETEEMNQFKDAMDQWGIPQIEETMYSTNNRDQLKACFNVLAAKGMLRWDDKRLYRALNKFTDITHKLPIPAGDPYKKFGAGAGKFNGKSLEGKNVIDFLGDAIDSLWGEGSYVGWKRQNDGAIESAIQQSYNKGEELENDPKNVGGIAKELSNLLTRHMQGDWIDPTEYEGLLRFIIEAGKAGGKHKIYYLIMGVTAKNKDGRTILGWERIGRFVSKYSNQFPALDFFSGSNSDPKRDFVTGEFLVSGDGKPRPYMRSDFEAITEKWVTDGISKGLFQPGEDAERFLRNQVLTTDAVQARLEKGIRNAQNMDHDDSPYYIPGLKESEIESVCASTGGDTKKFTIQGYKNAYIGFGIKMTALVSKYEEEKKLEESGMVGYSGSYMQKLITAFKSYVHYDGILDNRYKVKRGAGLQRLSSSDYQTGCVWDSNTPLKRYQDEMKGLIIKIAQEYGHGDDPNIVDLPFRKGAPDSAIDSFGARFEKMIRESDDKGAKLIEIIGNYKFLSSNEAAANPEFLFRNRAKMYEYDAETVNAELPPEEQE